MSAPMHTPGPWSVDYDDRNGQCVVCAAGLEVATCWHHSVGSIEKEMRANARLIAAAPQLLEACEDGLAALKLLRTGLLDRAPEAIAMIDAHIDELEYIIAKAGGAA